MKVIAENLKTNPQLKSLNLWGNEITNVGAEALAKALENPNPNGQLLKLNELNLGANYIDKAGVECIINACKSKGIQNFNLGLYDAWMSDAEKKSLVDNSKLNKLVSIHWSDPIRRNGSLVKMSDFFIRSVVALAKTYHKDGENLKQNLEQREILLERIGKQQGCLTVIFGEERMLEGFNKSLSLNTGNKENLDPSVSQFLYDIGKKAEKLNDNNEWPEHRRKVAETFFRSAAMLGHNKAQQAFNECVQYEYNVYTERLKNTKLSKDNHGWASVNIGWMLVDGRLKADNDEIIVNKDGIQKQNREASLKMAFKKFLYGENELQTVAKEQLDAAKEKADGQVVDKDLIKELANLQGIIAEVYKTGTLCDSEVTDKSGKDAAENVNEYAKKAKENNKQFEKLNNPASDAVVAVVHAKAVSESVAVATPATAMAVHAAPTAVDATAVVNVAAKPVIYSTIRSQTSNNKQNEEMVKLAGELLKEINELLIQYNKDRPSNIKYVAAMFAKNVLDGLLNGKPFEDAEKIFNGLETGQLEKLSKDFSRDSKYLKELTIFTAGEVLTAVKVLDKEKKWLLGYVLEYDYLVKLINFTIRIDELGTGWFAANVWGDRGSKAYSSCTVILTSFKPKNEEDRKWKLV